MEPFPFHLFVQYISGRSSYEMVPAIREFYDTLGDEDVEEGKAPDGRMTEEEFIGKFYPKLVEKGVKKSLLAEVFGHDRKTLNKWSGIDAPKEKEETPD